jgi:hypothetical protein
MRHFSTEKIFESKKIHNKKNIKIKILQDMSTQRIAINGSLTRGEVKKSIKTQRQR